MFRTKSLLLADASPSAELSKNCVVRCVCSYIVIQLLPVDMDPQLAGIDSMTGEDPRDWWQLPYVAEFCYFFRPAFSLPDFILEDLEEALTKPGLNGSPEWKLICDIHVRLLRGITPGRGVNADNWQFHLRKLMRGKARKSKAQGVNVPVEETNGNSPTDSSSEDGDNQSDETDTSSPAADPASPEEAAPAAENEPEPWNPLGVDTDYRTIALHDKVAILYLLCEMRLMCNDVHDVLKGWDGDYLRIQPIGQDRHGNRYWFLDSGLRLYKETTPKGDELESSEDEKPKKKKPTPAKAKRGPGRPRKEPAPSPVQKSHGRLKRSSFRNAVNKMSNHQGGASESEEEEEKKTPEDPRSHPTIVLTTALLGNWSVIANTQEEWEELTERMCRGRNADERALGKFIQSEVLEEVIRKKQLREKQQRKKQLLESMPRRASDRITIMKMTRQEEAKQAELREEMREAERREAEELRQKRQAENRREMREKRRQMRAEAAGSQGLTVADESRSGPPSGISEEKYDSLYAILEALRRNNNAWLFEEPVTDEMAPNYSLVIRRPMELTRVEKNLDEYAYSRPGEFVEDLRVMCANCRLYNGPRSPYFKMADNMEAAIKRQVAKHLPRVEWGDPPELPPSDPIVFVRPKPVKRKSLDKDDAESPQPKVKAYPAEQDSADIDDSFGSPPPETKGALTPSSSTQMSSRHPVAASIHRPRGDSPGVFSGPRQFPPFCGLRQPMGANAMKVPGSVPGPDSPHAYAGLGAWGPALGQPYRQPQAPRQPRFQHPASHMPAWLPAPAVPTARGPSAFTVASMPAMQVRPASRSDVAVPANVISGAVRSPPPVSPVERKPSLVRSNDTLPSPARQPAGPKPVQERSLPSLPNTVAEVKHRPVSSQQPGPSLASTETVAGKPAAAGSSPAPVVSARKHASRPLSSAGMPLGMLRMPSANVLNPLSRPLAASSVHRPHAQNSAPAASVAAPVRPIGENSVSSVKQEVAPAPVAAPVRPTGGNSVSSVKQEVTPAPAQWHSLPAGLSAPAIASNSTPSKPQSPPKLSSPDLASFRPPLPSAPGANSVSAASLHTAQSSSAPQSVSVAAATAPLVQSPPKQMSSPPAVAHTSSSPSAGTSNCQSASLEVAPTLPSVPSKLPVPSAGNVGQPSKCASEPSIATPAVNNTPSNQPSVSKPPANDHLVSNSVSAPLV